MFTGLIEEVGKIASINAIPGGKKLEIEASFIMDDVKVDDSVCINGVCLTATSIKGKGFTADAVGATLSKTTIADLKPGDSVNLERSLRLSDRLGGHMVQGHVNGIGIIAEIQKLGDNYYLEVEVPGSLKRYLINEGSIAIDGISLTIANISGNKAGVSVIPHTWSKTNLNSKRIGGKVNIETDVIAKYVEKLLNKDNEGKDTFSEEWFRNMGY